MFKEFAENADAIIAASQKTKEDYLKFFNFPEEKIHVIYQAPTIGPKEINQLEENKILSNFALSKKEYFLSVGGISVRKNSFRLVQGFALSRAGKVKKLVIAGKIDPKENGETLKYIREDKLGKNVIITNYISDKNLHILYKNAASFLLSTIYEGFGIPIIEAMMHKLPVLTSTTGAAPEVANGHAVLVNPFDPEEIAKGIDALEKFDEKQIKEVEKYAKTFTWERTVKQTIEVYKTLL